MAISKFLDFLLYEKNYALHTITAYQADLEAFDLFCKENYAFSSISKATYNEIRAWIIALSSDGISNRTINRKISTLRSYYKFLIKVDEIDSSPLHNHKALKTKKKIQVPFSQKEVQDVLNFFDDKNNFISCRNRLLVALLYVTGMRRSELTQLRLRDVDLHTNTLKILGKRGKERLMPLLPAVLPICNQYVKHRKKIQTNPDSYFFVTQEGDRLKDIEVYRMINRSFSLVTSKAKKSPHILRHSFATALLTEGADIHSIKEMLGHASLAATQIYTQQHIAHLQKIHGQAHPRSKQSKKDG